MDASETRARLLPHVERCVVRHATADIELASGRMSDFYFDGRRVTLTGVSLELFARLVLDEIDRFGANAVGGPTIGADPVVGAVIALAAAAGKNLKGFLVRKEPKSRGMKKQVEGPELIAGDRALLVEDTVTSGGSLIRAAEALRREYPECELAGAVTLVDREEGGAEALETAGLRLVAVFKRAEFAAV